MIFFSELKGRKVESEDGIKIGNLEDIIFLASESASITKFFVRTPQNSRLLIPVSCVLKIGKKILISKNFTNDDLTVNELFVLRNLLDKQIIDLKGNKVVRVNDVLIQERDINHLYVSGVDIGFMGILRWFGVEPILQNITERLKIPLSSIYLSWAEIQPLELARGKVKLTVRQEKLAQIHPADLAEHLEKTNTRTTVKILDLLEKHLASQVVSELKSPFQSILVKKIGEEKTAFLLEHMDPDESVDVLLKFPHKRRELILSRLHKKKREEIEDLLKYASSKIGRYLSGEYITVEPHESARVVLEKVRSLNLEYTHLDYIYVINELKQLVGVLNLYELIQLSPETTMLKAMHQDVFVCHLHSSTRIVMRKLVKYHLYALPVVNEKRHLLGVIKRDDLAEEFITKI